jgi:hypothetical protein
LSQSLALQGILRHFYFQAEGVHILQPCAASIVREQAELGKEKPRSGSAYLIFYFSYAYAVFNKYGSLSSNILRTRMISILAIATLAFFSP